MVEQETQGHDVTRQLSWHRRHVWIVSEAGWFCRRKNNLHLLDDKCGSGFKNTIVVRDVAVFMLFIMAV